jgi:uncharacterized RDD family membrane protein YckC
MTPSDVPANRPRWWPRIKASLIDYLVIVAWFLVLTGLSLIIRPLLPLATESQDVYLTDLIVFATTVLPVWLYLTLTEASVDAGTLGKRIAHLRVRAAAAGRAGRGRVAVRNAIKLMPWQLGHVAVARFILGVQLELAIVVDVVAALFAVATVVVAVRHPERRALHDLIAGTGVIATR